MIFGWNYPTNPFFITRIYTDIHLAIVFTRLSPNSTDATLTFQIPKPTPNTISAPHISTTPSNDSPPSITKALIVYQGLTVKPV